VSDKKDVPDDTPYYQSHVALNVIFFLILTIIMKKNIYRQIKFKISYLKNAVINE